MTPICVGCGLAPDAIPEYVMMAMAEEMTPDDFVRSEEGTYNPENGHFLCTSCFITWGQPSSPMGWKAP